MPLYIVAAVSVLIEQHSGFSMYWKMLLSLTNTRLVSELSSMVMKPEQRSTKTNPESQLLR
jgi:hypothetical protein